MRTRTATALLSAIVAVGMAVDLAGGAGEPRPRPVVLTDATAGGCLSAVCSQGCPHANPAAPGIAGRRLAWHCRHHPPKRRPTPAAGAPRHSPSTTGHGEATGHGGATGHGERLRPGETGHDRSGPPHPTTSATTSPTPHPRPDGPSGSPHPTTSTTPHPGPSHHGHRIGAS